MPQIRKWASQVYVSLAFIRSMSHSLRNPLYTASLSVELLRLRKYGDLNPKQIEIIERIQRNHHKMLSLTDDLMYLLKSHAGELKSAQVSFQPRILIQSILDKSKNFIPSSELKLVFNQTDEVPENLVGDHLLIEHILNHLLWNAIAFTPTGTILVDSSWENQWNIQVTDSGNGIEDTTKIFDAFWQGTKSYRYVPSSGAGVGLTVAQALAEMMGGKLQLVNTAKNGTTFELSLKFPNDHLI